MKHILLLLILGSFPFIRDTPAQTSFFAKGTRNHSPVAEWTTLRGNNNRDGRIVSMGEFKTSATLNQAVDYSTSEAYMELFPAGENSSVNFSAGKVKRQELLLSLFDEWQTETKAYLDLFGDGKPVKVSISQNVKYARLFVGDNNYYRIEAYDGFDVAGNVSSDIFIGIRVYLGNTGKLVLEKRFPKGVFMQRPHVTVADMNNDGQKDIVITSWEGIYVFNNKGDSIAGLSQDTAGWHHLRKRGFACLTDIDGNGYKDVIIISSLPWHLDVIKNNGGVLQFGWTRIFDGLVESAKKISKPILNSVSDFDGDGTYEILVNVYNYNGDHNWSGVLFDATNGEVKAQIRDAYVLSAEDLNRDGSYVFFCAKTKDQSVPISTELRTVEFKGGEIRELLRIEKGEWINPRIANTSPTVTTHWDGVSNLAEDAVLCVDVENSGQKAFFARIPNPDGSSQINGYYLSKEGKVRKAALTINVPEGMYGEIVRARKNADGRSSLLLQVKAFGTPEGTIQVTHGSAKNLGRFISPNKKTYIPVVADIDSDGVEEILIPNDVGEVLCFTGNSKGEMRIKWKVPGHGMLWQYAPEVDYGICVDDIDHDGNKEVIVSGANEEGAALFVYDHNGKLLWQKGFPEINAGDITLFDGNLAFYGTAQSSKRKNRDVIVTVQRGIAHEGKTYCLNGMDGTVIWALDTLSADKGPGQGSPVISGAGGNIFSVYDIDGDGSDEVMCGYGNVVFFAENNDGTLKFKEFMRKLFTDKYDYPSKGYTNFWMAQVLPVAFHDDHNIALSCFNTVVAAGTMDTNGVLSWCPERLEYSERYWQCMANLDGDGKLWVVEFSIRNSDNVPVLFAYDPANGGLHKNFSIDMPGFVTSFAQGLGLGIMPVAGDVNGDGKDEIILSNSTGVYCMGKGSNEKVCVLWKYAASDCGQPVLADVDSDGFIEVVVANRTGKILILDK